MKDYIYDLDELDVLTTELINENDRTTLQELGLYYDGISMNFAGRPNKIGTFGWFEIRATDLFGETVDF